MRTPFDSWDRDIQHATADDGPQPRRIWHQEPTRMAFVVHLSLGLAVVLALGTFIVSLSRFAQNAEVIARRAGAPPATSINTASLTNQHQALTNATGSEGMASPFLRTNCVSDPSAFLHTPARQPAVSECQSDS